jgi:hypothetical protein
MEQPVADQLTTIDLATVNKHKILKENVHFHFE